MKELAKFDTMHLTEGNTINGVTIDNFVFKDGDNSEVIGGDWSSTNDIGAIVVKGSDYSVIDFFSPATASGAFSNDGLPDAGGSGKPPAISNLKFCSFKEGTCDPSNLGSDIVDNEERTVSNTMHDDEGIAEFSFTTLDNFTVVESSIPEGFARSVDTWTWNGTEPPPTDVSFTLQAGEESSSTYFLVVTNSCGFETNFDPIHDLGPGVTQLRLVGTSPNPFREWTTVEFAVPEQTDVRLTVYNVMGQKVATLVDGIERAGTHTLTWQGRADSGRQLASGVYLLRLEAGDWTSTRRLTIVR